MSQSGNGGRPRVLHVGKFYPPHKGGMETHLRDLCERLQARYDARVVVANDGPRGVEETVGGVRVTRLGTPLTVAAAPVCPGLARRIRDSRAALVHLHFPHPTAVLAYLRSGHPGPLVVTYHSDVVRQKLLGRAFLPILHRFLARARAVIVTSPDYVESSPVLGGHRERCRVIPLGVETERFARVREEEVRRVRERFGERLVLGVGRLIYYKGFAHLVRAMRKVDGRLLLIGEGPLRAELEREARESGVEGRVHFLGEVSDAAPFFRAADVFALPSVARSEAFGIVQLEAMACGVPVVNTRLDSGVPFVSPDGVTGLTVPPADEDALASAINRLLDDPSLRARLGDAGQRRVRELFTADVMAEQTMKLYAEVMAAMHS